MKSGFGRMRRRNHSWLNRHGGDYKQRTVEYNEHGEAHRKTWSSTAPDFIPSRLDLLCHWNQLDSGERVKSTNYTALHHFNPIHCTAFCHQFIHTHSYIQVLCWWTSKRGYAGSFGCRPAHRQLRSYGYLSLNRAAVQLGSFMSDWATLFRKVLLDACETWTVYRRYAKKFNHFHIVCLRKVINIKW